MPDLPEPERVKPDAELSARMSVLARSNTKPEVLLRRALHRRGLRFRLQVKVPGNNRRTIDIAFPRARLAVFVDGCFWHGCPEHHVRPKANREWWEWKLEVNRNRDRDTDRVLQAGGWQVVRIWEHEDMDSAAAMVSERYQALKP